MCRCLIRSWSQHESVNGDADRRLQESRCLRRSTAQVANPAESTDFLGPYAMFAESGRYNVYAVAESRRLRTLTGGLDVIPQLSFKDLFERLPHGPDVIVIPAMVNATSPENRPILDWLRRQARGSTLLFSWCEGAEVLAAAGLL